MAEATQEMSPETARPQPAPDAAEIEKLRKLAAERDQYLDMAQRQRAEFENYQKRSQKEREQERRYALASFAYDLLPVIDNLERALQAAQQSGETGGLVQGVAMVQAQLMEQLKRHGVARIDADGKPFDPNLHQAVMQRPAPEVEPNTVLQVLEAGYTHHDRVLRPAQVIVSARSV
jgi:molecular chaperone GrpE